MQTNKIKLQISRVLSPLLSTKKRFKIVIGGRGSGKSQGVADIILLQCMQGNKIGCFREYQNSLSESVYALLCAEIERAQLPGFTILASQIEHSSGGKIVFRGLSRNPDAVKSMHGFKIFWCEEAQALSEESLRILTPTLRESDSEIFFTANPMSAADPFSERFIKPFEQHLLSANSYSDDLHLIIKCNYTDNPWFPAVLEQDRQFDYDNLPRALYDHIWLGAYNDSVEHAIITADMFDACVDAHKKLGFKSVGQIVCSHDPADSSDARAYACRHGSVITDVQQTTALDVNDACDWALGLANRAQCDVFVWDADGLGLSLKRQISEAFAGKKTDTVAFRGGADVDRPDAIYDNNSDVAKQLKNKDAFFNLRAQKYCELRDRMQNTFKAINGEYKDPSTLISIDNGITCLSQLKSELCRIPQVPNGNGQIQLMRKDQMKSKLKIASPNLADAVMMLFASPQITKTVKLTVPKYNWKHA